MPDYACIPVVDESDINVAILPREYDYWKMRERRTFFIDYEIDDDYSLIDLSKTIIQMNTEELGVPEKDLKPIFIYIHSYGGDTYQAMYFADLLVASRIPIVTIATGVCMSAGCLILLGGHRRYAFKHSQILIHSGNAGFSGTSQQIDDATKNYKDSVNSMKNYILERSSIDEKLFSKNKNKDWYIVGEEIEKLGIAKLVGGFGDIV